jgi:hypothetical protein
MIEQREDSYKARRKISGAAAGFWIGSKWAC